MTIRAKSPNTPIPAGTYEWTATIFNGRPGAGERGKPCGGMYTAPVGGNVGDFLTWLANAYARKWGVRSGITVRDYKLWKK